MTFGLCVRECYTDAKGQEQMQFGVIVTTRLPCIGRLCPFISKWGVLSIQSSINAELGRSALELLKRDLTLQDAVKSLLAVDDTADQLQVHGLSQESTYTYSGTECVDWFGDEAGANYTVAGNMLVNESVVSATAETYGQLDRNRPLAERLITALKAGHQAGGDKRSDLHIQSIVLRMKNTENQESPAAYFNHEHDLELQVDASETPFEDLQETHELADRGFAMAAERYA